MGNVFVDIHVKMVILILPEVRPAEGQLEREAVNDVELLP